MRTYKDKDGGIFENYMNSVLFDSDINIEELEWFINDVMKFKQRIEIHSNNRIEIQMRTEGERVFFKITMKFIKRVG